jgi:hypothetical protein
MTPTHDVTRIGEVYERGLARPWRERVRFGSAAIASALVALVGAVPLPGCTTYVQPIECEGARYRCGEHHDIRFCEYIAVSVTGADCTELGLIESKPFCVVTPGRCLDTHFVARDRNCDVRRYQGVREWAECSPGTPTFIAP